MRELNPIEVVATSGGASGFAARILDFVADLKKISSGNWGADLVQGFAFSFGKLVMQSTRDLLSQIGAIK